MARDRNPHTPWKVLLIILMVIMVAATGVLIKLSWDMASGTSQVPPRQSDSTGRDDSPLPNLPSEQTQPEQTTAPTDPPNPVVSAATVSAQGDLLMHKPIFDSTSACYQGEGSYDFSSVFRYLGDTLQTFDYSLANLETTFGGDDFVYQGWPLFNCPDPFADALVEAGYDMLLTANNHCYDTLMTGLTRTLEVSREKGLDTLGTRLTQEEDRYSLVEVNGIRLGMICYTYTTSMSGSQPRLNGNTPVEEPELVNYFSYGALDTFYSQVEQILGELEAAGAEATVLYIHWGTEYEISQNADQQAIAQKLCDLGIDVIVGGHPHVVQPMELLTSTADPNQKTVCIYSLGNAVSNQRIEEMRLKTGHTEDGVLFTMTFEKYVDGNVYLSQVKAIPTWVNMHTKNGGREYNILPLDNDNREDWQTLFQLTDEELGEAEKSYQRTMNLVGSGMEAANAYFSEQKAARDAAYASGIQ